MRKRMRAIPTLVLVLAACTQSIAPTELLTDLERLSDVPATHAATVVGDTLELTGFIVLGNPCHDLAATGQLAGQIVTVRVVATARNEICIQVIAAFGYRIHVRGLAPGQYDLRLGHSYAAAPARDSTVFRQTIVLP